MNNQTLPFHEFDTQWRKEFQFSERSFSRAKIFFSDDELAIIEAVHRGEIMPQRAEEIAKNLGFERLERNPLELEDSLETPEKWETETVYSWIKRVVNTEFWSLPMVATWIGHRNPWSVRLAKNEFQTCSFVWRKRTSDNSWRLVSHEHVTLAGIAFRGLNGSEITDGSELGLANSTYLGNNFHRYQRNFDEIKGKCFNEELKGFGLDPMTGLPVEIHRKDWKFLCPWPSGVMFYGPRGNEAIIEKRCLLESELLFFSHLEIEQPVYYQVYFSASDVLQIWPLRDNFVSDGSEEHIGAQSIACNREPSVQRRAIKQACDVMWPDGIPIITVKERNHLIDTHIRQNTKLRSISEKTISRYFDNQ